MARNTSHSAAHFATKTARLRLAPRSKPYYSRVRIGKSLGYVRRDGAPGKWMIAEWAAGREKVRTLGTADDYTTADGRDILTYQQALAKASKPELPPRSTGHFTVSDALTEYYKVLAATSSHAKEAEQRADKHIVPVLGATRVDRLTKAQIEGWLAGMVRLDEADPDAKRRSCDSANRVLTILKAALNKAFQSDNGEAIPSDRAWRTVKPFQNVGASRVDHFTSTQVRLLIAKADGVPFRNLLEAGYMTGARYGELAGLDVADFDAASGILSIHHGKTGPRPVTLTAEGVAFFKRITKGRPGNAVLLPRPDGDRWGKSQQAKPFKRAARLAELPASASFYALRHSYISRAAESGLPLPILAENVGTSVGQITRHYAKVLAATRTGLIERHAPRLRRVK